MAWVAWQPSTKISLKGHRLSCYNQSLLTRPPMHNISTLQINLISKKYVFVITIIALCAKAILKLTYLSTSERMDWMITTDYDYPIMEIINKFNLFTDKNNLGSYNNNIHNISLMYLFWYYLCNAKTLIK